MPASVQHKSLTLAALRAVGVTLWGRRFYAHDPANGWYWARGDGAKGGPFPSAMAAGDDALGHCKREAA